MRAPRNHPSPLPEHLQRPLHPPERRAHLHALHASLHLLEHLAGDLHPFGERRFFSLFLRLAHPGQHRLRHGDSRHFVREELGVAQQISGQMPATIGILNWPTRARNASSCAGSNTGWVTANSAPASTFHAKRDSSRSRSTAPGFTPTPIAHCVGAPIGLFPGSSPWLRRYTRFVSPIESMSKTAVASG